MSARQVNGVAFVQIISALLIVNYHSRMLDISVISRLSGVGFVMNIIFVLLSGFLLARSLTEQPAIRYRDFLWRRFRRVYPSLHVALVIAFFIYLIIGRRVSMKSFILSATGFSYVFGDISFGIHLWFVSMILILYVLCLPTLGLLRRFSYGYLVFILLLFLVVVLVFERSYCGLYGKISSFPGYRYFYHYMIFSLGMFFGIQRRTFFRGSESKWIMMLFLVFPVYVLSRATSQSGLIALVTALLVAMCIIAVLMAASQFFEKKIPYLFGLSPITYELYLIHFTVIEAVDKVYHGRYVAYPLVFLISMILAFIVLKISAHYLRFINRLGGWFQRSVLS